MTIDDLLHLLTDSAGHDDALDLTADISDTDFEALGYDSLAIMETAARIEQEYGVTVPDDRIADLRTPRALVDLVNGLLAASA